MTLERTIFVYKNKSFLSAPLTPKNILMNKYFVVDGGLKLIFFINIVNFGDFFDF